MNFFMRSVESPLTFTLLEAGGVYGQDNHTLLQGLIDSNPNAHIILGSTTADIIYISKPLVFKTNTIISIYGTLKLTNGVIRPLTQDAATGQNRVYVDNADGSYKVGQFLTVGALNYPTGGGGSVARLLGQSGKVINATTTYVEFEFNLRSNVSGINVGALTVANSATIGHNQTMIYCRDINNVSITGSGIIDGNLSTMHSTYHPCAMGGTTSSVPGYEDSMGGNGIVFWNCNNVSLRGVSPSSKITTQEFNIGSVLAVLVDGYNFSNWKSYHPQYKHLAFALKADNGLCENLVFDTSYNEDGLSCHDEVHYSTFRNVDIYNCPRIGLGVGSGSHHNLFENFNIDLCNLSLYTLPSQGSPNVHHNTFNNIVINRGIAGITQTCVQDTVFNNVTITNGRAGNHCITIGGQCSNIIFNSGGCYDTAAINSNSGWGFRTVAKEVWHIETTTIIVNDFEFKRLNRGIVDLGNFPVIFNRCVLATNDLNGDLASADFTLNSCIVDGNPYP